MFRKLLSFFMLAFAVLACAIPGAGVPATPNLGAVQTEVAVTLTAAALNPGVTLAVPPTEAATPLAAVSTPVPPTLSTPTVSAPLTPCFVAIGYLTTLLCQNGPNQIQIADTSVIGPLQRVEVSSDGGLVAYTVGEFEGPPQLWVVNGDGSNSRKLVDSTQLPPAQPATLSFPRVFHWQTGTHTLFFDTGFVPTTGVGGPGEYVNFDLWKLDADSGALTQLLSAGSGGYFSLSPDGGWVAVTRPQDVSLISTDGATVKPNLLTFTPVITYSEYAYKPEVTWSLDSTFFIVNVPSNDPLAPNASATIHKVQVDGVVTSLKTISGQFLFDGSVKASPDGQWVAYVTNTTDGSNQFILNIEQTAGAGSSATLLSGAPTLFGWSPDSQLFAIFIEGGGLQYSGPGAFGFELQPLAPSANTVKDLVWSDAANVVFSGTVNDHWGLRTAPITGAGAADLAGPFGSEMVFDVR